MTLVSKDPKIGNFGENLPKVSSPGRRNSLSLNVEASYRVLGVDHKSVGEHWSSQTIHLGSRNVRLWNMACRAANTSAVKPNIPPAATQAPYVTHCKLAATTASKTSVVTVTMANRRIPPLSIVSGLVLRPRAPTATRRPQVERVASAALVGRYQ